MITRHALAVLLGLLVTLSLGAVNPALAALRGGSNYAWFDIGTTGGGPCDRKQFGVIEQYHLNTSTINSQLQQMYNNGQRRLRIPILHSMDQTRADNSGTIIYNSGGWIAPQYRQNLEDLLTEIKAIGFKRVYVGFFPQGTSHPRNWSSWNETAYQGNWNLIVNLRPIIAGVGINYKIDLMNEGIPHPDEPGSDMIFDYAKKLWQDYHWNYGAPDTVGFSISLGRGFDRASEENAIRFKADLLAQIYGPNFPYTFDVHLYPEYMTNGEKLELLDDELSALGYTQGIIVGEVYYNDSTAAANMAAVEGSLSRTLWTVLQWPLHRNGSCSAVDTAPPLDFNNYINYGF